ncbi:MAG: DUF2470 domain-containing protein [Alphaproteobacteria bacterium]|nr:DUF2470 domain-containing protein [Alphaproteobacteria bacterium]
MADTADSLRPAVTARRLLRGAGRASLATSLEGRPYASLVLIATAPDGAPLLLLSDLAQHTRNIAADRRVSLLIDGSTARDEPLAGARVTLIAGVEPCADPALLARFCLRHPSAAAYAGFGDFRLYRIAVERAHLVAGFGRIAWVDRDALLPPGLDMLAAAEPDILRHMNEEHGDAVQLYAERLCGRRGEGWRMTGIDPEGLDLGRGGEAARLDFAEPLRDADAVRPALAALAREARGRRG